MKKKKKNKKKEEKVYAWMCIFVIEKFQVATDKPLLTQLSVGYELIIKPIVC